MAVTRYFERQPRSVLVLFGLALLLGIAAADYAVSMQLLEFPVLYLIPVSFFTWYTGRRWGFLVAIASAAWVLRTNLRSYEAPEAVAYWNALILFLLYLGAVIILGELRALYIQERDLSRVDSLTRLPNRRAFFEFAEVELSRSRRSGRSLTLVYLDVDEFKSVNDQFGHLVGDEVLQRVAMATQACLRLTDMGARMGGDEFALLLPETDRQTAEAILNRIRQTLKKAMQRNSWPVTFSIGSVTFRTVPDTVDEMIRLADEEMYQAKAAGKDRMHQREVPA